MAKTLEEKISYIMQLRPIDDVFFEVLAEDPGVMEEILRVIMDDPGLTVESVTPQRTIGNLLGRAVRLDALCRLGDGRICNIEVQKADNDDHLRRARYNASGLTWRYTLKGDDFKDVPQCMYCIHH